MHEIIHAPLWTTFLQRLSERSPYASLESWTPPLPFHPSNRPAYLAQRRRDSFPSQAAAAVLPL